MESVEITGVHVDRFVLFGATTSFISTIVVYSFLVLTGQLISLEYLVISGIGGAIAGVVWGFLVATIYNIVASLKGGLVFEVEEYSMGTASGEERGTQLGRDDTYFE